MQEHDEHAGTLRPHRAPTQDTNADDPTKGKGKTLRLNT